MAGPRHEASAAAQEARIERLYRRHSDQLFRYCLRRTGNRTIADEIRSAVFYEAWRRRHEVDLTTREALPWLYGVAANLIRNHARATRRRDAAFRRLRPPDDQVDFADEVMERLYVTDRARAAIDIVNGLPSAEREVVLLCLVGDLSYRAAATELGLPIGTVRSRLFRARARMRLAADGCER
jgi:RNA polymerase sigma-70 factor (ECF subfamily)